VGSDVGVVTVVHTAIVDPVYASVGQVVVAARAGVPLRVVASRPATKATERRIAAIRPPALALDRSDFIIRGGSDFG
jgi:hypothetical protein